MEYQYSYSLLCILFFIIWMGLFVWRKDTREKMLVMSGIFAIAGPLYEYWQESKITKE